MKKYVLFILCNLMLSFNIAYALDSSFYNTDEWIDKYEINIDIAPETRTVNVNEIITYNFGQLEGKHGIYRDIPYIYNTDEGTKKIKISDVSVVDENNSPYNFEFFSQGNDKTIKIGDADKFVSGVKIYNISYKVYGVINFFESHDELFWNAIGNYWTVPINNATINIRIPGYKNEKTVLYQCFTGLYGDKIKCENEKVSKDINSNVVLNFSQEYIPPENGFTVVAGYPKGIISPPPFFERYLSLFYNIILILIPIVVFIFLFRRWDLYGKDPKGRETIIPEYEPPKNLTPSQAGTIIDERVNKRDISADLINLAIRGYIKIKKIDKSSKNYLFTKLKEFDNSLKTFEKDLLTSMFKKSKDGKTVELKDLENKFADDLVRVEDEIYNSMVSEKYFLKHPKTVRTIQISFAVFLIFTAIAAGFFSIKLSLVLIACAIPTFIFAFIMPKKTKQGVLLKEYILGLKMYINIAEKDRIKFHNSPSKTPELFEKLLPYAMMLKLEKEWGKQFQDIYKNPPSWYEDPQMKTFSAINFSNSLHGFSSYSAGTLSSTPSSAAGGSSGFGGGGFSGGGFGGGGGGSW